VIPSILPITPELLGIGLRGYGDSPSRCPESGYHQTRCKRARHAIREAEFDPKKM